MLIATSHFKILKLLAQNPGTAMYGGEIAAAAGIGRASVYVFLGRMAEAQWLTSEVRPGPNGPPLRYYRLTGLGEHAYRYGVEERRPVWADAAEAYASELAVS